MCHCVNWMSLRALGIAAYCGVYALWASPCSPVAVRLDVTILLARPRRPGVSAFGGGRILWQWRPLTGTCSDVVTGHCCILGWQFTLSLATSLDGCVVGCCCLLWWPYTLCHASSASVAAYSERWCVLRRPRTPIIATHCSGYVLKASPCLDTAACSEAAGVLRQPFTPSIAASGDITIHSSFTAWGGECVL